MSYARWAGDNGPWYAWGGDGPSFDADGKYKAPPVDGPLVLALHHHDVDHPVYITYDEALEFALGRRNLQDLFAVKLTDFDRHETSRIMWDYMADVEEEAGEAEGCQ